MTRRKDGLYQEAVTIKGRRKYFYGHTKAEVLKKIREFEDRAKAGVLMSDALDCWMDAKERLVSYKTIEGYKTANKKILDRFGDCPIAEITPAQIQLFIKDLAAKGYKRSSVQRPLDVMRMIFDFAIIHDMGINTNPCAAVRMPSGLSQERRELASREDVEIVKKSLDIPFGLFPFLIMYSGLRDGEALALRREDFTKNGITVSKSVSWQTNKPIIKDPKTKNAVRTVPILSPLQEALPKKWSGYLFSADGGETPLTNTQFRRRWNAYCKAAGLADSRTVEHKSNGKNNRTYTRTMWENRIVPYQLRHEFATICFEADLDPHDVMHLMGHANETMARQIYTHILESRKQESVQKLENYVKKM